MDYYRTIVLEIKYKTSLKIGGSTMGNVFLATVTALSIGLTSVVTAGSGARCHYMDADGNGICGYAGGACSYVDADGDGVCDYAGDSCHYIDADGDGVCDYAGGGRNYVDADGDEVCDHYASGHPGRHGNGFRGGHCR